MTSSDVFRGETANSPALLRTITDDYGRRSSPGDAAPAPDANLRPAPPESTADITPEFTDGGPGRKQTLESLLMRGSAFETIRVTALLKSAGFQEQLRRLHEENVGDQDAVDLERAYRTSISSAVASIDSKAKLSEIACGLSLCGAEIVSANANQDQYFDSLFDSSQHSGAKIYSAITQVVDHGDGSYGYRLVFTTDPAANKIVVPESPSKP